MPHVGPVKDEEGAKCPFAKQQSPAEEKTERGKLVLWSLATSLTTRDIIQCVIR